MKDLTPTQEARNIFESFLKIIGSDCEHESYCEQKICRYKKNVVCCVTIHTAKECSLRTFKLLLNENKQNEKRYLNIMKAIEKI